MRARRSFGHSSALDWPMVSRASNVRRGGRKIGSTGTSFRLQIQALKRIRHAIREVKLDAKGGLGLETHDAPRATGSRRESSACQKRLHRFAFGAKTPRPRDGPKSKKYHDCSAAVAVAGGADAGVQAGAKEANGRNCGRRPWLAGAASRGPFAARLAADAGEPSLLDAVLLLVGPWSASGPAGSTGTGRAPGCHGLRCHANGVASGGGLLVAVAG